MGKNDRLTYETYLHCECGTINSIRRIVGRHRKLGHVKDLYCYGCKKDTKQIEIPYKWGVVYGREINFIQIKEGIL